ncbi:MAG: UvrD-helicase domain-containing protein [Bacteroidota bacterium]|nr:UvrD-helicase domain-containing protein [Bacteroidota bacterium]
MEKLRNFKAYHSSAGSGKTYTLALHYILIALKGDRYGFESYYKNILAITFTNKASNEMKERILDYLQAMSLNQNKDNVIDWIKNNSTFSKQEISSRAKKVHRNILHNYTDFSVSTIDKFTYRLIRTFSRDLGLSYSFELEMDNYKIIQKVVALLLSNISNKERDLSNSLVEFALHKISEGKSSNIEEDLESFTSQLFKESAIEYIKKQNLSINECMQVKECLYSDISKLKNKLKFLSVEATNYFRKNNLDRDSFIKRPSFFDHFVINIIDSNDRKWFPSSTLDKNITANNWYPKSQQSILAPLVDPCVEQMIVFYERLLIILKSYNSKKAILQNIYSISIMNELIGELNKYKKDHNIEQLSTFNKLIHDIIVKQPSAFIYERLGERYNHFLIDEFQDTSILQWQNCIPLIVDSLDYGMSLIVGDAKQSIYRWRAGEMNQFINLPLIYKGDNLSFQEEWENKLSAHYHKHILKYNFRSLKEIITFNNLFFNKVKHVLDSNYQKVYTSNSQSTNYAKEGGYVCIEQFANDQFKDSVCERIITEIHHLINKRNYKFSDIAILCNSNRNTSFVAEKLITSNINVVSNEGILLSSSEKVHCIISVLQHLSNPLDPIARVVIINYLNNKIFNTDSHKLYSITNSNDSFYLLLEKNNIHFKTERLLELSLYQLVEQIIVDFKISNDLYTHFFKDCILKFELKEGSSIPKFLIFWEEAKKKETINIPEKTNAVNIMTVHKAKGLAFNIVFIPFNWDDSRKTDEMWVDTSSYLKNTLPAALININSRLDISHFSEQHIEEKELKLLDNLNKLYVAMTRAKERLYIFTKEYPKKINEDFFKKGYINSFLNVFGCDKSFSIGREDIPCQSFTKQDLNSFSIYDIKKNKSPNLIRLKSSIEELWDTEENNKRKDWGNLLHLALSSINEITDINNVTNTLFLHGKCSEEEKERLKQNITSFTSHPSISHYFKKGLNIKNEQGILLPNGKTYIPDRLIFDNNQVVILDYKTGKKRKNDQNQIDIYADTLDLMGYKVSERKILYLEDYI